MILTRDVYHLWDVSSASEVLINRAPQWVPGKLHTFSFLSAGMYSSCSRMFELLLCCPWIEGPILSFSSVFRHAAESRAVGYKYPESPVSEAEEKLLPCLFLGNLPVV